MKLIRWIKSLFVKPPTVRAEEWWWKCYDPDCGVEGEGTEERVRLDSTTHCFIKGHTVSGGVK